MAKSGEHYVVGGTKRALQLDRSGVRVGTHDEACCCDYEPPACICDRVGCTSPPEYFCIMLCGGEGWCTGLSCGYVTCVHGTNCRWTGFFTSGDFPGRAITLYYQSGWKITIANCVTAKPLSGFTCTGGYADAVISITPVDAPEDCPDCAVLTCGCYRDPQVLMVTFHDIINCDTVHQDDMDGVIYCAPQCMDQWQCEGEGCCCPEEILNDQTFYLPAKKPSPYGSGWYCGAEVYDAFNCFYGQKESTTWRSSVHFWVPWVGNDCHQGDLVVWVTVQHRQLLYDGTWGWLGENWLWQSSAAEGHVTRRTGKAMCNGDTITVHEATGQYLDNYRDYRCGYNICVNGCRDYRIWGCGGYAEVSLSI